MKNSGSGRKMPVASAQVVEKPKQARPVMAAVESKVLGFLARIDQAGVGGWVVDFANPNEVYVCAF